jgi:hypothetical protein
VDTGNGPSTLDGAIFSLVGGVQKALDRRFPGTFHQMPAGGMVH